jgi:5-methylcytosine-specific restriction protein B
MSTEEYITQTSDGLLDVLLDHWKRHPDFRFWLRSRDRAGNSESRLEKGYWFMGSDYIFLAPYAKTDWKNKTKTFGFVIIARNPDKIEMYIEWIYNAAKPEEEIFYKRLPEIFPNPTKVQERKYRFPLKGNHVIESFQSFLNHQLPKVDALLKEVNLLDKFAIPQQKFEKRLKRTLELREMLKNGTLSTKRLSEEQARESNRRYWVVAPGDNAKKWEEFYKKGIIGIGWEDTGDLSDYDSREEIRKHLLAAYPEGSKSQKNNSLALWEFFDVMKPGDILIPKRGTSEYLGYGIVTGEYVFDDSTEEYHHTRKVDWKKKGQWPEDVHRIVTKTLTDITKYPEYVDRLKRLIGIEQEAIIPSEVNYWWINANPNVWRITDFEVGQEQTYTTLNEKGNKRTHYEYFHQVKKGDLFLGYASSPVKKVVSIFEATKPVYVNDDTGQEEIAFVIQKFLPDPVAIETVIELPEFTDSEIKNNRQGSLYKLTKEQYHAVLNDDIVKEEELEEYAKEDALQLLFIENDEFDNVLETLRYKKNIILQGAPGTGKTFMAKLIAYAFMEEMDNSKIEMIQFHQSYSYEDFMQGYRPTEDGKFRLEFGVFYRFCKRAQSDPNKKYFFIIDEINRGNLSKIFGELMLLLEGDKRGPEFQVSLTYSQGLESKFHIPENVYLIGTMNTADRSLSIVDYALRRRFAFIDVVPTFNSKFKQYLRKCGVGEALIDKICTRIDKLNTTIEKSIGRGFRIGHSYFCNVPEGTADEEWYNRIIAMEVDPLLREYWFDKIETAEREIENLYT